VISGNAKIILLNESERGGERAKGRGQRAEGGGQGLRGRRMEDGSGPQLPLQY